MLLRRQVSDSPRILLGVPNSCPKVSVRSESDRCRTNRLRQQVISERWRRHLAADCRMRVNISASPQILQILFAPADTPLIEAQVTAICWIELEWPASGMMRHDF